MSTVRLHTAISEGLFDFVRDYVQKNIMTLREQLKHCTACLLTHRSGKFSTVLIRCNLKSFSSFLRLIRVCLVHTFMNHEWRKVNQLFRLRLGLIDGTGLPPGIFACFHTPHWANSLFETQISWYQLNQAYFFCRMEDKFYSLAGKCNKTSLTGLWYIFFHPAKW